MDGLVVLDCDEDEENMDTSAPSNAADDKEAEPPAIQPSEEPPVEKTVEKPAPAKTSARGRGRGRGRSSATPTRAAPARASRARAAKSQVDVKEVDSDGMDVEDAAPVKNGCTEEKKKEESPEIETSDKIEVMQAKSGQKVENEEKEEKEKSDTKGKEHEVQDGIEEKELTDVSKGDQVVSEEGGKKKGNLGDQAALIVTDEADETADESKAVQDSEGDLLSEANISSEEKRPLKMDSTSSLVTAGLDVEGVEVEDLADMEGWEVVDEDNGEKNEKEDAKKVAVQPTEEMPVEKEITPEAEALPIKSGTTTTSSDDISVTPSELVTKATTPKKTRIVKEGGDLEPKEPVKTQVKSAPVAKKETPKKTEIIPMTPEIPAETDLTPLVDASKAEGMVIDDVETSDVIKGDAMRYDPQKDDAKKDDAKKDDAKEEDVKKDDAKDFAQSDDSIKDEAKKDDAKKDVKREDPKKDDGKKEKEDPKKGKDDSRKDEPDRSRGSSQVSSSRHRSPRSDREKEREEKREKERRERRKKEEEEREKRDRERRKREEERKKIEDERRIEDEVAKRVRRNLMSSVDWTTSQTKILECLKDNVDRRRSKYVLIQNLSVTEVNEFLKVSSKEAIDGDKSKINHVPNLERAISCNVNLIGLKGKEKRGSVTLLFGSEEDAKKAHVDLSANFPTARLARKEEHFPIDAAQMLYVLKVLSPHAWKNVLLSEIAAEELKKVPIQVPKPGKLPDGLASAVHTSKTDKTLYISNLPAVTTDLELCTVFRDAEAIVLPTNADGSAKGYAYVEFKDAKLCKESLDKYRGANISGNNIFVDLFENILASFLEKQENEQREKEEREAKAREEARKREEEKRKKEEEERKKKEEEERKKLEKLEKKRKEKEAEMERMRKEEEERRKREEEERKKRREKEEKEEEERRKRRREREEKEERERKRRKAEEDEKRRKEEAERVERKRREDSRLREEQRKREETEKIQREEEQRRQLEEARRREADELRRRREAEALRQNLAQASSSSRGGQSSGTFGAGVLGASSGVSPLGGLHPMDLLTNPGSTSTSSAGGLLGSSVPDAAATAQFNAKKEQHEKNIQMLQKQARNVANAPGLSNKQKMTTLSNISQMLSQEVNALNSLTSQFHGTTQNSDISAAAALASIGINPSGGGGGGSGPPPSSSGGGGGYGETPSGSGAGIPGLGGDYNDRSRDPYPRSSRSPGRQQAYDPFKAAERGNSGDRMVREYGHGGQEDRLGSSRPPMRPGGGFDGGNNDGRYGNYGNFGNGQPNVGGGGGYQGGNQQQQQRGGGGGYSYR